MNGWLSRSPPVSEQHLAINMERESGKNINSSCNSSSSSISNYNNIINQHHKERIGGDPPLTFSSTTGSPSSSPDFVLQWGNKKRPRCMKIQSTTTAAKGESSGGPPPRNTARVDRRVIRTEKKDGLPLPTPHPAVDLPRPASHPVLRNSEITMRGCSQVHGGGGGGGSSSSNNGVVVQEHVKQQHNQHHTVIENKRRSPPPANTTHHHVAAPAARGGSAETIGHEGRSGHGKKGKGGGGSSSGGSEVIPPAVWPTKFVIALTNKEKEEDFLAIKGSKLPQRPKKRSKYVQRNLNLVSPGTWLCELTLERYEVREKKTSKKRPRGLKAMCSSVESESE